MALAHYRSDRMFFQTVVGQTGGWYFQAREGKLYGPYDTRLRADLALREFVADCIRRRDSGGRDQRLAS